jgi:hypothetical protein
MKRASLAFLFGLPALSSFAADLPCVRTLGSQHESTFISASPSELQIQANCLAWEASVQPKAEFIPPARDRAAVEPTARRVPAPDRPGWPLSFSDLTLAPRALSLGNQDLLRGDCCGPSPTR